MTEVERLVDPAAGDGSTDADPGALAIVATGFNRALLESLSDMARRQGWDLAIVRNLSGIARPDLLMVDCYFRISEAIQAATAIGGDVPVLALLGFARQQDRDALARVVTNSTVVDKPYSHLEIRDGVRKLMSPPKNVGSPRLRLASGTGR